MISNGELSDPLCDSVNRGLTLVRLQAHTPHAPTLFDNAAHNEWQCHAIMMDNRTENHNQISVIIGYT